MFLPPGPDSGEAHRTFQIAIGGNFDEADAGVLFMFGTKAAIVGAALVGAGAVGARRARRLAEFVAVVIGNVGADEVFDEAVFGAALTEVDAAVADDDLGVHQPAALGTETAGGPEEGVIADVHGCLSRRSGPSARPEPMALQRKGENGQGGENEVRRPSRGRRGRRCAPAAEEAVEGMVRRLHHPERP